MSKSSRDNMFRFLNHLKDMDYIKPEQIPNIDLYMDQVTHFMNENLNSGRNHPDEKILTKTMINNYTKNNLLPPPEKKKYSKEHLLLLVFIYYMKDFLSMGEMQRFFGPLTNHFFQGKGSVTLTEIYTEVFSMSQESMDRLVKGIMQDYKQSAAAFSKVEDQKEKDYLTNFAFLSSLGFDIYIKKLMIEQLLDSFSEYDFTDEDKNSD